MQEKKIYRPREVSRLLGISKSTLYAWVRQDIFPPPLRLGLRSTGWTVDQINNWINSKPVSSPKGVKKHERKKI